MFSPGTGLDAGQLEDLTRNFDHHSLHYRTHSIDLLMHLQEHRPFAHSDHHGGFWIATKAADCLEVAKDAELFSNWPAEQIPALEPTLMIPLNVDPPQLYDYRAVLTPLFSPARVKEHAASVRKLAEDLLDKIIASGGGDLKWEYALPLTGIVTCDFAGLDPDGWRHYAPALHELSYSRKPLEERLKGMAVMIDHMRGEIRRLKDEPVVGSAIDYLFNVEMAGRKLTVEEIDSIILILLGGGLDTTQALFTMVAVYLGRNPYCRRDLIDNPGILENAIEEFLRVFPPTQGMSRRATRDTVVAGKEVKADEQVYLSFVAANRDPDDYPNPHDIDFRRENIRHLSFGIGPHRCLGSHLARLEAKVLLEVLLEKAPDYQLVEDGVELADDIGNMAGYGRVQVTF